MTTRQAANLNRVWRDMLANAKALARRIMPDVRDTPIYLIPVDEMAGGNGCCHGFTGLYTAHDFRDRIPDWKGGGVGVIFNRPEIERVAIRGYVFDEITAVLVHELAHQCEWLPLAKRTGWPMLPPPMPAPRMLQTTRPQTAEEVIAAPYDDHPADDFGRALAHLAFRAQRVLGWPMPISRCGWNPIHARASVYAAALASELEPLAEMPVVDVLKLPAPAPFVELCRLNKLAFRSLTRKDEQHDGN